MDEWRPIETAPKDGTEVLIYDPDAAPGERVALAAWVYGSWDTGRQTKTATHWRPKPQPPEGSEP